MNLLFLWGTQITDSSSHSLLCEGDGSPVDSCHTTSSRTFFLSHSQHTSGSISVSRLRFASGLSTKAQWVNTGDEDEVSAGDVFGSSEVDIFLRTSLQKKKKRKCQLSTWKKGEMYLASRVNFRNGVNVPLRWGVKKVDMVLCLVLGISILVWVKERATSKRYPSPLRNGFNSLEMGRADCFWNKTYTMLI